MRLVYVVEGLGQIVGLIAQPLNYYLKEVHGWTPVQVTAFLTVFNLPWIIKPVYGLISDFVPLFGYRRKSYLIIANVAAIGGYFWVDRSLPQPSDLAIALMLTAYAMAISSTLCGAVLVENGQRLTRAARSSISNGSGTTSPPWRPPLSAASSCSISRPLRRLHVAAAIVAVAPSAVIVGTLFLIPEKKTTDQCAGHEGDARTAWLRPSSGASCGSSPSLSFSTISAPA